MADSPAPPAGLPVSRALLAAKNAQRAHEELGRALTRAQQALAHAERDLAARLTDPADADLGPLGLSARQEQVLRLLADGLITTDIGLALGLSEHTVKKHLDTVMTKLGAKNRAHAVALAYRRGLLR